MLLNKKLWTVKDSSNFNFGFIFSKFQNKPYTVGMINDIVTLLDDIWRVALWNGCSNKINSFMKDSWSTFNGAGALEVLSSTFVMV